MAKEDGWSRATNHDEKTIQNAYDILLTNFGDTPGLYILKRYADIGAAYLKWVQDPTKEHRQELADLLMALSKSEQRPPLKPRGGAPRRVSARSGLK